MILLKKTKTERKIMHIPIKGGIITLIPDFSTETMEARKQWTGNFKVLGGLLWFLIGRMGFGG